MHHNIMLFLLVLLLIAIACCLIPLDKNLGVCPIEIGEILQRIAGRVVISRACNYAVGSSQLCAGQIEGCKAAAHNKALFLLMVSY